MLLPFLEPGPGGCLDYISHSTLGHRAASTPNGSYNSRSQVGGWEWIRVCNRVVGAGWLFWLGLEPLTYFVPSTQGLRTLEPFHLLQRQYE